MNLQPWIQQPLFIHFSEAPPAAAAAGTAAVASAAPSAAARTGASPRGHSPLAAAALPSPVSGLGSGTAPGSPCRHFDSDWEQEGLAPARP